VVRLTLNPAEPPLGLAVGIDTRPILPTRQLSMVAQRTQVYRIIFLATDSHVFGKSNHDVKGYGWRELPAWPSVP
jgi:hypothetical protein